MRRTLVAIGGNEVRQDESDIFREMVRLAGGRSARIAVVPTASSTPEERGRIYTAIFTGQGAGAVDVLPVRSRASAADPAHLQALMEATLVMFTGGDQLRLTAFIGGTPMDGLLRERYEAGCVVAGSSAGAAALGDIMIFQNNRFKNYRKGGLEMTLGLGLLRDAVFDTHFVQRNRVSRLVHAVATNPRLLGLGIEENTALVIEDETSAKCLGAGTAIAIDGRDAQVNTISEVATGQPFCISGLKYSVLTEGSCLDLRTRRAHPTVECPAHILEEIRRASGEE